MVANISSWSVIDEWIINMILVMLSRVFFVFCFLIAERLIQQKASRYYGWDLNLQLHLQTSGNEKLSQNRVQLMVEFTLRVSSRAPQPLPIKCTIFHSLFLHFPSLPWLLPPLAPPFPITLYDIVWHYYFTPRPPFAPYLEPEMEKK